MGKREGVGDGMMKDVVKKVLVVAIPLLLAVIAYLVGLSVARYNDTPVDIQTKDGGVLITYIDGTGYWYEY